MVRVMARESFYRTGTFGDDALGVAAGWAVHGGGFAADNPYWNDERTIALLFTGEEFSDPSTVPADAPGAQGTTEHSARTLLAWYEKLGLQRFLETLNGTFSGLILDRRTNEAHLFTDRFGLGRLYVHEGDGEVLFASEAKSILSAAPATRRLDPRGVAEYSSCGCVLQNRTLFEGISLLPQGSCWTFGPGLQLRKQVYADMAKWAAQPRLSESDFYDALKSTFGRIVPKYLRGKLPIGMSLTGGLDGRMIMACSGMAPGALPCYTFGGPYRDCQDVRLARRIAAASSQPHQVIPIGKDFAAEFGALAAESVYVSDGAMDVTGSAELYVNRRARALAPVRLTGNYGSEILRSNVAFKAQALDPTLFSATYLTLGDQACSTYASEVCPRELDTITRKQVPWHHHSRLAVEQSLVTMRSPYLDNELVALAYRAPRGHEKSKTPALRFVDELAPALSGIPTDRGLLYRPTPVMTKLSHLYQEFTFRAEYAYDYGMPQWVAGVDHAFSALHLERLFLGRHKFYHFRIWYRDLLAQTVRDVLLDPRSMERPHVRPDGLRRIVSEHLAGTHNHTTPIHQALSLELIHRELVERAWD